MTNRLTSPTVPQRDATLRRAAADAIVRAGATGDARASARWLARAMRLLPQDPTLALLHARAAAAKNPAMGIAAAESICRRFPAWAPAYLLHAYELLTTGEASAAALALAEGLSRAIAPPETAEAGTDEPPGTHDTAAAEWIAGRRDSALILVTHADGGGIERYVRARATALLQQNIRPIIVRPRPRQNGQPAWSINESGRTPELMFAGPDGLGRLAALLAQDNPRAIEFHHAASHDAAIETLPALLGAPYDVYIHDYAAVCPRVTLCGGTGKYCGEPADPRDCEDCVADHGARLPYETNITAWRDRSRALLAGARRVVTPSSDTARRIARHFPASAPHIEPWADDADSGLAAPAHPRRRAGALHVAILGALTRDKGFDILLACARDAARRDLPLRFTLVGHSIGDERLLATDRVFVTGPFQEGEAPALLAETDADIALLPAVWPETWSYALSDLWRAGLWVVAFDLGAPAERIRAAGGGTLLPPGMPAARLNDALLTLPFIGRTAEPRAANVVQSHADNILQSHADNIPQSHAANVVQPHAANIVRLHARA